MVKPIVARRDPTLHARIKSAKHLVYDAKAGAPGTKGSPVRAGSGLAFSEGRMVLIHDDADMIAVIEGAGSSVVGLPLKVPTGPMAAVSGMGAARNAGTLQLEAMVAARDWRGEYLLAFGSGSAASRRCIARVRLHAGDTELSVFETRALYQALEELENFADGTLDIEGAAMVSRASGGRDVVRLFHRGHGRPSGGMAAHAAPAPATVDMRLDALLAYLERVKKDPNAFFGVDLENVRRYDLGSIAGVPIGFTDAAGLPSGKVAFIGAAEVWVEGDEEGEVVCALFGVIEPDGSARYNVLLDEDGEPSMRRAEGLALVDAQHAFVVSDQSSLEAAMLCEVELNGI